MSHLYSRRDKDMDMALSRDKKGRAQWQTCCLECMRRHNTADEKEEYKAILGASAV